MKPVALHCTKLVHQTMIDIIRNCLGPDHRFPAINAAITRITVSMLDRMAKSSKLLVERYIEVQAESAFTNNIPYTNKIRKSMSTMNLVGLGRLPIETFTDSNDDVLMLVDWEILATKEDNEISERQAALFAKIRGLVNVYFQMVRYQVADHVPKTLLHSMIHAASEKITAELVKQILK